MEKKSAGPRFTEKPGSVEDDRRDYDPADYRHLDDRRFSNACKEALFAQLLCVGSVLAEFGVAYAMSPSDVEQMTYVFGLPTWFVAASCVAVVSYLIMLVYCVRFSKEFSLEARERETEEADHG